MPSVYLFAVQTHHCPGIGGGFCHRSARGPCPAVLAGQRNSQAAFLNSVPTATAALTNQTVNGEKTLEEEDNLSCCDKHKTAERDSHGVQYCTLLRPPLPLFNHLCFCIFISCVLTLFLFSS